MQKLLKTSSTPYRLVEEWGGTNGQLSISSTIDDIERIDNIPTIADVSIAFDNTTSVEIISRHLQSLAQYACCEFDTYQLAETALSILKSYYFLNLAEICLFFTELKNGKRGQFVWGNKLNNQAIMVALNGFCSDRNKAKNKIERENQVNGKSFNTITSFGSYIAQGIENYRTLEKKAKEDYDTYLDMFPHQPTRYSSITLWKAWNGDKESFNELIEKGILNEIKSYTQIGKLLCDYNANYNKQAQNANLKI